MREPHSSARSTTACSSDGHAADRTGSAGSTWVRSTTERHRSHSYRRPGLGKRPAAAGRTPSRNNKHGSSWKELLTNLEHDGRVKTLGPVAMRRCLGAAVAFRVWRPALFQGSAESSGSAREVADVFAAIVPLNFHPSLIARVAGKFPVCAARSNGCANRIGTICRARRVASRITRTTHRNRPL